MLIEKMATELGIPVRFVQKLANSASHEYKSYNIPKRSGGFREIHHPSRQLKGLQRWLLTNVIDKFPVHEAATAYRKGGSIFKNAATHATSRYLLRMDFENFFPSIKSADLRAYLHRCAEHQLVELDGWTSNDTDLFCQIVLRHSALTIGAPTSPALSNAICYDLDAAITTLCDQRRVKYTRYADDLFFSTVQANILRAIEAEVPHLVSSMNFPVGLAINRTKTRHSSKKRARRVTGIVLGSDGKPYVGRKVKREIRALIHRLSSLDGPSRASLSGKIAQVMGFDPNFINSLILKYGHQTIEMARLRR